MTDNKLSLINKNIESVDKKYTSLYLAKQTYKKLTTFIECQNVNELNPQSIIQMGKVYVNNFIISDKTLY